MNASRWKWAAASALLGACGAPIPEDTSNGLTSRAQAVVIENGRSLNGRSLNGRSLNGRSLNGRSLNGRSLNGRSLNGRSLNGRELNGALLQSARLGGQEVRKVWLEGSELIAGLADGAPVRGTALVGAELQNEDGYRMRIDTAEEQRDVWRYTMSFLTPNDWEPLCDLDIEGKPAPAVLLEGVWDYREGVSGGGAHLAAPGLITFACTNAALGKCVDLGYAPWVPELASHHQACSRMLRADYCGDGRSSTRDGIVINVYDGLGIQEDTETWATEAEWDEDGASCVSARRQSGSHQVPRCGRELSDDSCGAIVHFEWGTQLMTEFAPK